MEMINPERAGGKSDPNDMTRIRQLWYQMFLSTLISSIVIHSIGSIILLVRLRSHHYAKWLALLVQLAGFLTPIFLGSVTNALIASILVISDRYELPFYIVISIGLAQTLCVVAMQFLKIIQTLWSHHSRSLFSVFERFGSFKTKKGNVILLLHCQSESFS